MVAIVALAFAVLDVGSASDLGLVLAARQGVSAATLIFGAVLSDRIPRNRVLVSASLLQGVAQAAIALTVITAMRRSCPSRCSARCGASATASWSPPRSGSCRRR